MLASLNFTQCVSEDVTINVTAKPVTFLRKPNPCCAVVFHMCSCKTVIVSRFLTFEPESPASHPKYQKTRIVA